MQNGDQTMSIELINLNGMKVLQFDILKKYSERMLHCFTTREGGVSTGECSTMNLSFKRNDLHENVIENYKRLTQALNIDIESIVLPQQVHDNKVHVVTSKDCGKGLIKGSGLAGYDALVTNEPGVTLVTIHADCVPVFLYDPVKNVIGLAHSGWKGTAKNIASETVDKFTSVYGSKPSDIVAVIGPSIEQCCFEVGDEVKEIFDNNIRWSSKYSTEINEKWHIDLKGIIFEALINKGLLERNIFKSQICTMCNMNLFFSHRGEKGKTGSMAAVMQLYRS